MVLLMPSKEAELRDSREVNKPHPVERTMIKAEKNQRHKEEVSALLLEIHNLNQFH